VLTDPTDLDWMELHLRCLYHHDANDRIVRARQKGSWPAPLFHLGRTLQGNLWRFRDDLDSSAIRELARLSGREPPFQSLSAHPPPQRLEAIRSVLRSVTEMVFEWRGPCFRFPDEIRVPECRLPLVAVTPGQESLLTEFFADTIALLAERQPILAAVADGRAVSMCYAARPPDVVGSASCAAAEVGVETVPGQRGLGLAPSVVAAWGRAVRGQGCEPIYSTTWDNKASRAVARKLGLICYGEDLHFT
jgi:hypothetical protein